MKKTITAAGDDPSGRWRAARYFVRGRPHWDNCWVDLSVQNDPRAWLEGPPADPRAPYKNPPLRWPDHRSKATAKWPFPSEFGSGAPISSIYC